MDNVSGSNFVSKAFDKLIAAVEAFALDSTLAELSDDELRALEMRLAVVCGVLGAERTYREDPYREQHGALTDGDKEARF